MQPTDDPIELFASWFAAAKASEPHDATAMALATADAAGRPSVRMVLLKQADARGFVFYSNLESRKAREIAANPCAALCFHWPKSERQVRVEGALKPIAEAEADAYFATRPKLSQIGAWASRQSRPMTGRFELERAVAGYSLRFLGTVPRPPHWSGWRLVPEKIEFWHQRPFRHHDRLEFNRREEHWEAQWLFP
jgi:pyridoxamine 5'-phosphate oxidase